MRKPIPLHKLKRGRLIQYPDGRIERVRSTFRFFPAKYFRRKGPRMYSDSNYIWATVHDKDFRILGFVKP